MTVMQLLDKKDFFGHMCRKFFSALKCFVCFDKNHPRMAYHFVCTLGLFSSFRDHDQNKGIILSVTALCGIKEDTRPTLTMIDQWFTTQIHHDILHQVWCFSHSMMAYIFNNAGPHNPQGSHHHQALFQEVCRNNFCWNPQETRQDLGFKIIFQPKLVHL